MSMVPLNHVKLGSGNPVPTQRRWAVGVFGNDTVTVSGAVMFGGTAIQNNTQISSDTCLNAFRNIQRTVS